MAEHQPCCTILTWNVQWASERSRRFPFVREAIDRVAADVIVLTEGSPPVLPDSGYVITSSADYGYSPADRDRRKVLLWSREPWEDVDVVGSTLMPEGRFVAGTTNTPSGMLRIIGVCIPWRDAHVRTGRKDRRPWEDHLKYLDGLAGYLAVAPADKQTVIAGDFNQRIPATKAPAAVSHRLREVLSGWQVVTAGVTSGSGDALIDHVALKPSLDQVTVEVLDRLRSDGHRLSDHDGVAVRIPTTHG